MIVLREIVYRCFSGKLVSRGEVNVPPNIVEEVSLPVRQFITAGAANQEVPDESVFRQMFVRGLEGESDFNKDGYITGTELATYLQDRVVYYRGESQTPQYGKIRDPKLDRGDFIFVLAKIPTASNPATTDKFQTEERQSKETVSQRGKKANRILFIFYIGSGNKLPDSIISSISYEFRELLISRLRERNLTVLSYYDDELTKEERSQYLDGINSRGNERAFRLLPFALLFEVTITSLEDLPQFQGLFVSKVSGHIEVIDAANNKTIGVERFNEIRGFGNNQDQAHRSALRSAAKEISDSFLNLVKEKSR